MKKHILLITFLVGILLVGIGTGIAFGEYSSFTYAGDVIIGDGDMQVETLECRVPLGEKKTIVTEFINIYGPRDGDVMTMAEDATLSDGQVRVEVVYNPEYVKPHMEFHEFTCEEDDYAGQIAIHSQRRINEFQWFMEYKDDFLSKMKDKTISNYYMEVVESITVKANGKTMAYLEK